MREILKQILTEAKVPINKWGENGAKRVSDLAREIKMGESALETTEEGLRRRVRVAQVEVICRRGDDFMRLKEDRQEMKDGSVRRRSMPTSIAEKIKGGEKPKEAAYRGVTEELGIRGSIFLGEEGVESEEKESLSYPGLKCRFEYYRFEAFLDGDQVREEGYREVQEDKTTYFVWEKRK